MLPFLKPKKAATTVYVDSENKEQDESLMSIAEALIKHIHEKDAAGVAQCLEKLEERDEAEDAAD